MSNKIFSGTRPSGKLHLGNYLGAIKNWVELQDLPDVEQAIFAVVDYHGLTTAFYPRNYRQQTIDVILDYWAAGVDPKKSLFIRQSRIPQHTALAWIFGTITPVGWLDRLPTYKEKLRQTEETKAEELMPPVLRPGEQSVDIYLRDRSKSYQNNLGLLAYPVLMAADILLYKSNLVPVGEDQMIHIDVANEIAKRFNSLFGETFEPVRAYRTEGARIMSLQNPTKKMSKTGDESIALTDSPDEIHGKIKRAVTDSGKEVRFNPKEKPAISNLMTICGLLAGKSMAQLEKLYEGKNYAAFKDELAEAVSDYLRPFREKRQELIDNIDYVEKILAEAEAKAQHLAKHTMEEIESKVGLI